jgi:hypothetical protein
MVYVDDAIWLWQGRRWCHLLADSPEELHRFANRLALHHSSYQGPPKTGTPHYDITGFERSRAIALGARPCTRGEIAIIARAARGW